MLGGRGGGGGISYSELYGKAPLGGCYESLKKKSLLYSEKK